MAGGRRKRLAPERSLRRGLQGFRDVQIIVQGRVVSTLERVDRPSMGVLPGFEFQTFHFLYKGVETLERR